MQKIFILIQAFPLKLGAVIRCFRFGGKASMENLYVIVTDAIKVLPDKTEQ
jgi:hypothetical protein